MTQYLLYKGPTNDLYTHGRWYRVISPEDLQVEQRTPITDISEHYGWFIVDDMGTVTNISKRNNMLWYYQGDNK